MVWSSKFAGAIPLSRWLRGIRWNHKYLQLRKQEMVVDSTFNFEKKRLTPTRRLVLGAATETARDEWKLSADNYMFFCCGNTQIRHERFHSAFHPCSMFCSWPPLQNMLFPSLFSQVVHLNQQARARWQQQGSWHPIRHRYNRNLMVKTVRSRDLWTDVNAVQREALFSIV